MKHDDSTERNERLSHILRRWNVDAPLPPRFTEAVWRRIERRGSLNGVSVWQVLIDWFVRAMDRPALALAYVTVLLLLGLAGGYWQTRQVTTQLDRTLAQRYVQTVDPFQPSTHD
jgi:hypothetical protein